MSPAYGINIRFPDGSTFYVPTDEGPGTMVAILDEFLDLCEVNDIDWSNLALRFISWYSGTNDLGIRIGVGRAVSTVHMDWLPGDNRNGRPSTWC